MLTELINKTYIIIKVCSGFICIHIMYKEIDFFQQYHCFSYLTLNEEVDVAEYPLAPDTRDAIEP